MGIEIRNDTKFTFNPFVEPEKIQVIVVDGEPKATIRDDTKFTFNPFVEPEKIKVIEPIGEPDDEPESKPESDDDDSDSSPSYTPSYNPSYSPSSYSTLPEQPHIFETLLKVGFLGALIGVPAFITGKMLYDESIIKRYPQLTNVERKYDFKIGDNLSNRHTNLVFNLSANESKKIVKGKSYRAETGLALTYPLEANGGKINVKFSVPDKYITKFEKVDDGLFSSHIVVHDGEIFNKLDVSKDGALQAEEIAVFYDTLGSYLDNTLKEKGYFNNLNWWENQFSFDLESRVNAYSKSWFNNVFLPEYIASKTNSFAEAKTTSLSIDLAEKTSVEDKYPKSITSNIQFVQTSIEESATNRFTDERFSFDYSEIVLNKQYTNFTSVDNLTFNYPLSQSNSNLNISIKLNNDEMRKLRINPKDIVNLDSVVNEYAEMGKGVEKTLLSKRYISTSVIGKAKKELLRETLGYKIYEGFLKNKSTLKEELSHPLNDLERLLHRFYNYNAANSNTGGETYRYDISH